MKFQKLMFLAAALAAAPGCVSSRTSGLAVEKGRLSIEDPAFAANLTLVQDAREKTPEGFLRAQVTVKNGKREDLTCQYRFEWRGKNGMIMTQAPAPWRPKVIHGRGLAELEAVAPLQGAEDFRLAIRRMD